ncbi:hypothetical protein BDV33DRAFT_200359 [Aspergillus novoparasiticus]|uniref:Uncharacterized protein n=1 Tax=Aspergillus novoparasiticus TaxID=986946 RepID=A0A5N6F241_9EURO|nr:hypothetical protein BDV33DRAFT_200359 [Aspergillus novoparasiticus]
MYGGKIHRLDYNHFQNRDNGTYLTGMDSFEALVPAISYELKICLRLMGLEHAVTFARILDLHYIESDSLSFHENGTGLVLASLEALFRSFWPLYVFEIYGSVRIGRATP